MSRADDLLADIHTKLTEVVTGADWMALLKQAAMFHEYSFGNMLAIGLQCPDATHVAGFHTWLKLKRYVRKGEKGIATLAPLIRKEEAVTDAGELTKVSRVRGFKVVFVFDVSQTEGEPLVEQPRAVLLAGEAPELLRPFLIREIQSHGYTLYFPGVAAWDGGTANGYTSFKDKRVVIRPDRDDAQQAKTLAHELGHVLMHDGPLDSRNNAEVEAESFAAVVCAAAGLDSTGYTMPYIASWSGGDMKLVLSTANRITKVANEVITKWEIFAADDSAMSA